MNNRYKKYPNELNKEKKGKKLQPNLQNNKYNNQKLSLSLKEYFHCNRRKHKSIGSESADSRSPESTEISSKGLPGAVVWEWWRAMEGEEEEEGDVK